MSTEEQRRRIVVGIDGSECSVAALQWGVDQARLVGAEVHAVMAWTVPISIYLTPVYREEDYERDAERLMDRVLASMADHTDGVIVRKHMVAKSAGLALGRAAEGADMLVVGSHGSGFLQGMHMGSVANYCAHHAPCPVLIYRG
ncbi:MAG: universal stress protein [Ornithinimicrobium sp.]